MLRNRIISVIAGAVGVLANCDSGAFAVRRIGTCMD